MTLKDKVSLLRFELIELWKATEKNQKLFETIFTVKQDATDINKLLHSMCTSNFTPTPQITQTLRQNITQRPASLRQTPTHQRPHAPHTPHVTDLLNHRMQRQLTTLKCSNLGPLMSILLFHI